MGALIYLKNMRVDYMNSGHISGYNYSGLLKIDLEIIGDVKDIEEFVSFARTKLIDILKNYSMDWHIKPDNPEHIEFLLNIMGDVMKLQEENKIDEAKALLELIEKVLPVYKDSKQYNLAEELRNVIYDNLYLRDEK